MLSSQTRQQLTAVPSRARPAFVVARGSSSCYLGLQTMPMAFQAAACTPFGFSGWTVCETGLQTHALNTPPCSCFPLRQRSVVWVIHQFRRMQEMLQSKLHIPSPSAGHPQPPERRIKLTPSSKPLRPHDTPRPRPMSAAPSPVLAPPNSARTGLLPHIDPRAWTTPRDHCRMYRDRSAVWVWQRACRVRVR